MVQPVLIYYRAMSNDEVSTYAVTRLCLNLEQPAPVLEPFVLAEPNNLFIKEKEALSVVANFCQLFWSKIHLRVVLL